MVSIVVIDAYNGLKPVRMFSKSIDGVHLTVLPSGWRRVERIASQNVYITNQGKPDRSILRDFHHREFRIADDEIRRKPESEERFV